MLSPRAISTVCAAALQPARPNEPALGTRALKSAGFAEITVRRCDLPITIELDTDDAVEFAMRLGPAGGIVRPAANREAHPGGRRTTGA